MTDDDAKPPLNLKFGTEEEVKEWNKILATAQQQCYIKNAGVMYYKFPDENGIDLKILYDGHQKEITPKELNCSSNQWFDHDERKAVTKIITEIKKIVKADAVYMNTVYVTTIPKESQVLTAVPVFYFKAPDGSVKYIDMKARVYNNWKCYRDENDIYPSYCCYPENGNYSKNYLNVYTHANETDPTVTNEIQLENAPLLSAEERKSGNILPLKRNQIGSNEYTFDDCVNLPLAFAYSPSCHLTVKKVLKVAGPIVVGAALIVPHAAQKYGKVQEIFKYKAECEKVACFGPAFFGVGLFNYMQGRNSVAHDIGDDILRLVSFAKQIKEHGFNEKKYEELLPHERILLKILASSQTIVVGTEVALCIANMLSKDCCTVTDYFNLAMSFYSLYGAVTSPQTAKDTFEMVKNEYEKERTKDTSNSAPTVGKVNKSENARFYVPTLDHQKVDNGTISLSATKSKVLSGLKNNIVTENGELIRLIETVDNADELFSEVSVGRPCETPIDSISVSNGDSVIPTETRQPTLTTIGTQGTTIFIDSSTYLTNNIMNESSNEFFNANNFSFKKMLKTDDYALLADVYEKNQQIKKWKIVDLLAEILDCENVYMLVALMDIVNFEISFSVGPHPGLTDTTVQIKQTTAALNDGLSKYLRKKKTLTKVEETASYRKALEFVNKLTLFTDKYTEEYAQMIDEGIDSTTVKYLDLATTTEPKIAAFVAYGQGLQHYFETFTNEKVAEADIETSIDKFLRTGQLQ